MPSDLPEEEERRTGEDRAHRLAALGEIAAEVAHELRNVLQIISASAFVARQNPAESDAHLAAIERNARLGHAIVDDLMALARGDGVRAQATPLADVLMAARADLAPTAAVFEDALAPPTLRARVHAGLAARLFHALYENAVAVCQPRSPAVVTRAWIDGARVVIEVEDDGPGVPADIASRLFEPLVSARAGGTGLGLALARRIAAALGGGIELADPGGEGRGARFRVTFPACDA